MQLKVKEALAIFKKLKMNIREGRDTIATFYYNKKLVVQTRVSHKRGDVGGDIPHFIRQQLKLNEEQFQDLKNCPLERTDYIKILKDKGVV